MAGMSTSWLDCGVAVYPKFLFSLLFFEHPLWYVVDACCRPPSHACRLPCDVVLVLMPAAHEPITCGIVPLAELFKVII